MTNPASISSERILRTAIVGYGVAGAIFHAPLIKATPGLRIDGIVTRSEAKQAQAGQDFPGTKIFSNADELWSSAKDFDLVIIATPNKDHAEQGKSAMKAGLSVVIDKPLAVSVAECEELIAVSKKTGSLLSVFHNRRWDNDFLTVKKLIDENTLGKLTRFESRFERYRPSPRVGAWRESAAAESGGGLLFDLGSHLIDQACQLFGQPESVYAELDTRREGVRADDDCFVSLKFAGSCRAHLWMSAIAATQGPRFRLLGLNGSYEKYGLDPQEDALRKGLTPLHPGWGEEPRHKWGNLCRYEEEQRLEAPLETSKGTYESFYAMMRDALLNGGPVPVSPEDALLTMRIIETARRSAERKDPLAVAHS